MGQRGRIGLVAATLLAVASALPERAPAQVPNVFDVRNPGFAPASPSFDTRSVLMTASTGWIAHRGMPATFVGCPRPSPYMFGSNPGMFHYGWYMSPFDVRFSRAWFFPHMRTWFYPSFAWYAGWGGRPGFAYGSYWRGAGPGAWGPWPGASGMCGPGSPSSAFLFGAGGFGFGGYPGFGGFGYGGFGSGYWGHRSGYWGYRGYEAGWGYDGFGGGYPGSPRTSGALGLDDGSGYVPQSLPRARGIRVIESRPTTGGADLRRTESSRLDSWFEELGPDARRVQASTPTSRDPIADALARTRASQQTSRESISDAIARARAARTGAAPSADPRSSERISRPARPTPRTGTARTGSTKLRSPRSAPRSLAGPASGSSARSAPKSPSSSPAKRSGRGPTKPRPKS
jgi:hypothetical protein